MINHTTHAGGLNKLSSHAEKQMAQEIKAVTSTEEYTVSGVLTGIEQTVNELLDAHNALVSRLSVALIRSGEENIINTGIIEARPVPDIMPPLAMRMDQTYSKLARLLQAQVELSRAVQL